MDHKFSTKKKMYPFICIYVPKLLRNYMQKFQALPGNRAVEHKFSGTIIVILRAFAILPLSCSCSKLLCIISEQPVRCTSKGQITPITMVIYNYNYFNNNSNIRWINSAPCAESVMLFAVVYDRSLFILFIYKLLPLACH
jgi:hypothetical protein